MSSIGEYGIISLIPVLVVIIAAAITKRTVEPLILGALVGHVILYRTAFLTEFLYGFATVIADNAWFVLVFGLFGMVVTLLEKSGGALGFADFGTKIAKTRASSLIITWVLGIMVFVDDYLNILGVGTAMRNITDKHGVAREFLAYAVNSTAASICVLVPLSSWGILTISIYENIGLQVGGSSYTAYLHTIPFIFYAWAALLLVPLFSLGVIPLWGPMKVKVKGTAAELRAESGNIVPAKHIEESNSLKKTSMWNFVVPMVALIVTTVYTHDILIGIAFGFVTCLVLYIPQRIMNMNEFFDHSMTGFKSMVLVTTIVLSAFLLQKANQELGLTQYVLSVVEPVITAQLLPVAVFLICSIIASFTGSFWGTMTIASPILIPLATSLGANPLVVGGAIVSAGVFGSHTCFFGDAVTLTSAVTGVRNEDYAKTAIPLIVLPTAIATVLFLVTGFIL